jgi:mannose-6-phosphate isomerase-like protein (cupin superfamily)
MAPAEEGGGVLRLTGDSNGKVENFDLPNGTRIRWTQFFNSPSSHVSIGRSDIDGPLMTKEKLNYTDVFYVAGGSMLVVDGQQKKHVVRKGSILLMPRGMEIEGRDIKHYMHFAASFESEPDDESNGPTEVRILHPEQLKASDFSVEGTSMSHVYYEGAGGVVVRAWQSTQPEVATQYSPSPWSELFFVISGSGTLTPQAGAEQKVAPGEVFFVPKGAVFKLRTHNLRTLAVVFDRSPTSATH